MNPAKEYRELLFNLVTTTPRILVDEILTRFNTPDRWDPRDDEGNPIRMFFAEPRPLDLSLAYVDYPLRGWSPLRTVFWTPRNAPGTTAFMSNSDDGMQHAVFRLGLEMPWRCIHLRLRDKDAQDPYPAATMEYYDNCGLIRRNIQASRQEKSWEFHQFGEVLPFENPEYYKRRRIRDRFNTEIAIEYLDKLGYHITEDDFWQTDDEAFFFWQVLPPQAAD